MFTSPLFGQSWRVSPYEINMGIGTANYFGDIGGSADDNTWYGIKNLDIKRTRPSITAGLRYFFREEMSVSASLNIGWISGTDEGWKNSERGYIFNTYFAEPSLTMEYFFIKDYQLLGGVNKRGMVRTYSLLSAYLFTGTGLNIYHVMPNENLQERQVQDEIKHGMVTIVIPAGAGFKIGISKWFDIGVEAGVRYSLNDFLDGFTSEISSSNDYYYLTNINLTYKLPVTR